MTASETAVKSMLRAVQDAMAAERVEPLTVLRVMNRLIYGDPRGVGSYRLDDELSRPVAVPVDVHIHDRRQLWGLMVRQAAPDLFDRKGSLISAGPETVRTGVADDGTVIG